MHLIIKLAVMHFILAGFIVSSTGAIELSGDISSSELSKNQSPYKVIGDIYVPSGKKVIIPAGVVFLFKALDNITLKVEGSLIVHGTKDEPVVFTSSNDPQFNPDSLASVYDWAGIKISGSAQQVMLRCAVIKYARNPVETRIPTTRFENVKFSDNMYSQLIINGKEYDISQELLFDYPSFSTDTSKSDTLKSMSENEENRVIKPVPDNTSTSTLAVPDKPEPDKNAWWHKKPLRLTVLGIGILTVGYGTAAMIISHSHAEKHDKLMADFYNDDLPNSKRENSFYDAKEENKISTAMLRSGIAGFAVGGACALGFVFTFVF